MKLKKLHVGRAELDSCNSSDALLMNVFCYPVAFRNGRLPALLGVEQSSAIEFGFKAKVPLANGRFDRTEVDMKIGSLLIEAKLTESGFQAKHETAMDSYRDFAEVFDQKLLKRTGENFESYQLLRNVLGAQALGCSFCVIHDARKPELKEAWYQVMRCVKPYELKTRCKVLTWQEIAAVARPELGEAWYQVMRFSLAILSGLVSISPPYSASESVVEL